MGVKSRLVYFEKWIDPIAVEMLRREPNIDVVRLEYDGRAAENEQAMRAAHGYQIAPRTELREPWFADAALLRRFPNLLAISSTGAGYDVIDVAACTEAGVLVVNQSGSNREAVAEHAVGLMLSLSKKIAVTDKALRRTPDLDRFAYSGNDLYGKTLGVIGLGLIGSRVVELCRAMFHMRVLAYDPYLTGEEIAARGAEKVELEELLRRSDHVTVHCPRTKETFGFLGRLEFALMKPTAYFVNTARGGIHREDDLAEAIAGGVIAGAGIDVFLDEPPAPDHPLFAFDNVIVTPHIAGLTAEAQQEMAASAVRQWLQIFAGERPRCLVNPEAWPKFAERYAGAIGAAPRAQSAA
jgi:D-3-phosphoglycerate dehydrogenase